jgi:hypothetical protein
VDAQVADGSALCPDATMPAFASHPNPNALVDDVLAYLKAMARHKQKPQ